MTFTVGDLFDIQITDADIDEEITRDALKLFTEWKNKDGLGHDDVFATQTLNKWRPLTNNVAIITTREDLKRLVAHIKTCDHFKTLFCFKNVLRVQYIST